MSLFISPEIDISEVKAKIEDLFDRTVGLKDYITDKELYRRKKVDLSKIDFEKLRKRFIENKKHIETERLKNAVNIKVNLMVMLNKSRKELLEKFQNLIEEYNSGAINVEIFFKELIILAKKLNEEEKRHVKEGLSEEELAMFDLLYKPDLTEKEQKQVKLAVKDLLEKLKKEKLVLDWRKKQQARASVFMTIQEMLNEKLPESYDKKIFKNKCMGIYQHLYDSYYGQGRSVYERVSVVS